VNELASQNESSSAFHRQQPGAQPQKCGFARSIGPLQQHNLALFDMQVDTGKRGVTVVNGHNIAKVDDRGTKRFHLNVSFQ
jgi:hypothetical protein